MCHAGSTWFIRPHVAVLRTRNLTIPAARCERWREASCTTNLVVDATTRRSSPTPRLWPRWNGTFSRFQKTPFSKEHNHHNLVGVLDRPPKNASSVAGPSLERRRRQN